MKQEEQDALWDFLGKARQPQVSPFFARNVMRQIRETESGTHTPWTIFSRIWKVALPSAAVVMLFGAIFGNLIHPVQEPALAQQILENPDYELIVHLDELLAYDESSLWLENSTF